MTIKLLVPINDSELSHAALPVAGWLARGLRAEVVLLTVGTVAETSAQAREERAELLKTLDRATPELEGLKVREIVSTGGDPVEIILRTAGEEKIDLIVMSTHGHSPLAELAQGSVAGAVVRAGIAPVTLVRPREVRGTRATPRS
jgi:nucleotide-binding universal stress UspA family protein